LTLDFPSLFLPKSENPDLALLFSYTKWEGRVREGWREEWKRREEGSGGWRNGRRG
jgi:hypothetical protein